MTKAVLARRTQSGIWLVYQTIHSGPDLQRRKVNRKTVSFQTEDSKKGTLTLNDIIPGEKETSFRINLSEQEDNYTFSGETVSGAGATVKYAGSITRRR